MIQGIKKIQTLSLKEQWEHELMETLGHTLLIICFHFINSHMVILMVIQTWGRNILKSYFENLNSDDAENHSKI